jgi:F0F1-type ATP synthase assembly protein I
MKIVPLSPQHAEHLRQEVERRDEERRLHARQKAADIKTDLALAALLFLGIIIGWLLFP